MSCDYRQLGDVAIQFIDGDRGKNYPSNNEFPHVGYCLFLNAKNVTPDGFSFGEVSFVTQKKDAMLRKGKLEKNDVVLTTRGTVGNVAFYGARVLYSNVRINSGMLIIRPDPSVFCPEYVYIGCFVLMLFKIKSKDLGQVRHNPNFRFHQLKNSRFH